MNIPSYIPKNIVTKKSEKLHISYSRNRSDYGSDTTAIVIKHNVFFILNGDHQTQLNEAFNKDGIQGCVDYFIENLDKANHRSEHLMAVNLLEDVFSLYKDTLEVFGATNICNIVIKAIKLNPQLAIDIADTAKNSTTSKLI